ncbi:MAG: proline dehydrogenase family protein [Candidatus Nanohaloarchaea archaeon]|nr:proline dehydrogenase family protein [Candidatus Nanohaloarchaea archaeon]
MKALLRKALLPVAKRFVAGETKQSAIEHVEDLNEDGIRGMVDLLGEHVEDESEADTAVREYEGLLELFEEHDLEAGLSVKPTHLGLEIGYEYCLDNLKYLVRRAEGMDRTVWLDMESSDYTQETIDLYRELASRWDNVGICIQCYLKRSENDIMDLIEDEEVEERIRLVKGAYDEPEEIAYRDAEKVSENFRSLLELLFEDAHYVAVGTHDKELVEYAKQLEEQYDRSRESFEFQFLMGVRRDLKHEIADEGYTVAEYVPYGEEWMDYYYRRVRERTENLKFAVRAFLGS